MIKLIILMIVLGITGCNKPDHKEPITTRTDYGTVLSVSDCRSGKYTYRCRVRTTLYNFDNIRISSYPGDMLVNGDVIFSEKRHYGDEIHYFKCKNDECVDQAVCYWWMLCFENKGRVKGRY